MAEIWIPVGGGALGRWYTIKVIFIITIYKQLFWNTSKLISSDACSFCTFLYMVSYLNELALFLLTI